MNDENSVSTNNFEEQDSKVFQRSREKKFKDGEQLEYIAKSGLLPLYNALNESIPTEEAPSIVERIKNIMKLNGAIPTEESFQVDKIKHIIKLIESVSKPLSGIVQNAIGSGQAILIADHSEIEIKGDSGPFLKRFPEQRKKPLTKCINLLLSWNEHFFDSLDFTIAVDSEKADYFRKLSNFDDEIQAINGILEMMPEVNRIYSVTSEPMPDGFVFQVHSLGNGIKILAVVTALWVKEEGGFKWSEPGVLYLLPPGKNAVRSIDAQGSSITNPINLDQSMHLLGSDSTDLKEEIVPLVLPIVSEDTIKGLYYEYQKDQKSWGQRLERTRESMNVKNPYLVQFFDHQMSQIFLLSEEKSDKEIQYELYKDAPAIFFTGIYSLLEQQEMTDKLKRILSSETHPTTSIPVITEKVINEVKNMSSKTWQEKLKEARKVIRSEQPHLNEFIEVQVKNHPKWMQKGLNILANSLFAILDLSKDQ